MPKLNPIVYTNINNQIMSQQERRQRQNLLKAQHQLKEIEYNCRDVVEMSRELNLLAEDLQQSEVNIRKIQFVKSQIKDKLKQFALYVDQIYKILDRKIIILAMDIQKQGKQKGISLAQDRDRPGSINNSTNKNHNIQKDTQKTNEKSNPSMQNDRFFTDTLNPRILQLEERIVQYQNNEILLNHKIGDLKKKNQRLMEQFTKLSNASNKKINQLSSELHNITSRDYDSFTSLEGKDRSPENHKPFLLLEEKRSSTSQSPRKNQETREGGSCKDVLKDKRPFTFGCMQINKPKEQTSDLISFSKNADNYEPINKEDRHRRFDLLLNKLRYGEKESKSPVVETKKKVESEEYGSVFSQDLVKRYQV